jgi:predicted PurR-regulated permease PerM
MGRHEPERRRLNRHVPVALMFAMVVQCAAVFLWIGVKTQVITQVQADIADLKNDRTAERLAKIETQVAEVQKTSDRIWAEMVARRK